MNTVLVTAGVVALLGAVIGGGFSALGIDVPKLVGLPVRIALGVLGVAFLAAAVVLREDGGVLREDGGGGVDPAQAEYQRHVVATCNAVRRRLAREDLVLSGVGSEGPVFDRDASIGRAQAKQSAVKRRLDLLLDKPAPDSLESEAGALRKRRDTYVRQARSILEELRTALPPSFSAQEFEAAAAPLQDRTDAVIARLENALADLAGRECRLLST